MSKLVSIHQPNFFPWLGYFDKIARSNIFILLDDVQYQKTGGVWTNRVKLLIANEAKWITAAIDRNYSGTRNINEMHFVSSEPWRKKTLRSIEANYAKHPYFDEVIETIQPLIMNEESNVARYNYHAICNITKALGLDTNHFRLSSQLQKEGASNELLASLTKVVGGDSYMCGGGAEGYQEEAVFSKQSIKLHYQNFKHPVYLQHRSPNFTSGLSIIDSAMNLGWLGVYQLLRQQHAEV